MSKSAKVVLGRVLIKSAIGERSWIINVREQTQQISPLFDHLVNEREEPSNKISASSLVCMTTLHYTKTP